MGVVAHSPPNFPTLVATFGDAFGPGPIQTFAGTPPAGLASGGSGFIASVNGVNSAIFAYGGTLLFPSLMAEMRHPMDFWKGLLMGQMFIIVVYLIFGTYVYHFQGQFTYSPTYQGISVYHWQAACNGLLLASLLIAATLYGNIGLKLAYAEVFQELLGFPALTTRMGKVWWAVLCPIYWTLAFLIGASVPQIAFISGFVAALFILSFTYTFPAALALGFWIRKDAVVAGTEAFDPASRTYNYLDSGFGRWWRGYKKRPFFNTFNLLYLLGSLAMCGLGCYTSITALQAAFASGVATSFTCTSPV